MRASTLKSNDTCWCGSGKKYKRCHKSMERPPVARPVHPGRLSPWREQRFWEGRP